MLDTKKSAKEIIKDAINLFFLFFKIGLFTFGGGYAMLSLIENEIVDKKGWITKAELVNIFAIAESTPGPIAINTATFVGIKRLGIIGGIIATIGVTIPSFAIIVGVSYIINLVKDNTIVQNIFKGIRIGVIVLIFRAFITFYKSFKKNLFSIALLIAGFLLVFLTNISVIYIILGTLIIASILVAIITYRDNHKFHMLNTPEYYSEAYGKVQENDEYYSPLAEKKGLIKIHKEDER